MKLLMCQKTDMCRKLIHSQHDLNDSVSNELEEYHLAKQIKLPSQVPASAGGLNKTSKETFMSQL